MVPLKLVPASGGKLFPDYVTIGNFDIAQFTWGGDAFRWPAFTQIYAAQGESNYGKIGSPEIDAKEFEETLSELDPVKARVLANELDTMILGIGHSLPVPGAGQCRHPQQPRQLWPHRHRRYLDYFDDRVHETLIRDTIRGSRRSHFNSAAEAAAMIVTAAGAD